MLFRKKNLRDKFAIFGDYLYFVMDSAEFVFTTVVLIVNDRTLDHRAAGPYEDTRTGPNQVLRPHKVLRTGPNQVLRLKRRT